MNSTLGLGLFLVLLLAVLFWLLGARRGEVPADDTDDETRSAEDEARELDALLSPEEAEEELPDWGPGAPQR